MQWVYVLSGLLATVRHHRKFPRCDRCVVSSILGLVLFSGNYFVASNSFAEEVLNIEGGRITGNREQPKVLYIIPWRQPEGASVLDRPIVSQVENVLAPIDRGVALRKINYYQRLKQVNAAGNDSAIEIHTINETQSRN